MSVPYRLERSALPIPESLMHRVAVTWNNVTIVWDPMFWWVIHYHISGKWLRKEIKCDLPNLIKIDTLRFYTSVQVVNDKMIVIDASNRQTSKKTCVFSLDLKTWVWEKHNPEGQPPPKSFGFSSWVHKRKMYCFGGGDPKNGEPSSSQLFCYDDANNCWLWPRQMGDIPPPRYCHSTIVSGDQVFLFGGEEKNDLYILNMESMRWKMVHSNIPIMPSRDCDHTFTLISQTTAVLFGSYWSNEESRYYDNTWLLDINNAKQLRHHLYIWTKIPNHHLSAAHAAIQEPVTKNLWVIGGFDANESNFTPHLLKMTFKLLPLRYLTIDHLARRTDTKSPRLLPHAFPLSVRKEIEDHRSKIGRINICSAKDGCKVCQPN